MTDLLQQSKKKTRTLVLVCGCTFVAVLVWALIPPRMPRVEVPSLKVASQGPDKIEVAPLDVKAFDTPVWTIAAAPPPPAPPTAPVPPPPPLKLQLIGIIKEEQVYKAVLYDPDSNKLFVVASGEQAQGHTVDRIGDDGITVRDGAVVRTLALKTGGGGP